MKKVALVFVLAVIVPSLVLAWLAVRSLRDQQFLLERQQSLIDQHVTDTLAQNISDYLAQQQQVFSAQVESLAVGKDARVVALQFDSELRQHWPLAEVGFCVTTSGKILSPSLSARAEAQKFYADNSAFLGNREAAEVYGSAAFDKNANQNYAVAAGGRSASLDTLSSGSLSQKQPQQTVMLAGAEQSRQLASRSTAAAPAPGLPRGIAPPEEAKTFNEPVARTSELKDTFAGGAQTAALPQSQVQPSPVQNPSSYKVQTRKVSPQSQLYQKVESDDARQNNLSKVVPSEAEFSQLIGNQSDGMLARFLQNKLKLMFWHRLSTEPDLIFGAELNLNRVVDGLRGLVQPSREFQDDICVAILDDNAKPLAMSHAGFQANWKHPFVATEIGESLPHWEVAAYLLNPAQLTQAAHTVKLTLGLLIAVLVLAIGIGSWLIVSSLSSELKLARQKTDFVSNVSHELKTPLTSIRMFSELLADARVNEPAKQRSYLNIIAAEAARLTRLINNVLDFSRMERGEKKYNFQPCDLTEVVRAAAHTFRPHLEANGFKFDCDLPDTAIPVRGDADALSQIIVNLLSNAEKYSNISTPTPSPRPSGEMAGVRGGSKKKTPPLPNPLLQSPGREGDESRKEISLQVTQQHSPLPHVEVRVLDHGCGVPRGSEQKIFEKFYRAHDSLSSGIQGSGLGLTIARQIARAHGGDVVYEARDGGGSCFILRLPLKPVETTDGHE